MALITLTHNWDGTTVTLVKTVVGDHSIVCNEFPSQLSLEMTASKTGTNSASIDSQLPSESLAYQGSNETAIKRESVSNQFASYMQSVCGNSMINWRDKLGKICKSAAIALAEIHIHNFYSESSQDVIDLILKLRNSSTDSDIVASSWHLTPKKKRQALSSFALI